MQANLQQQKADQQLLMCEARQEEITKQQK